MSSVAFLVGWVVIPAGAIGLLLHLRRRNFRSVRLSILILGAAVGSLAFFTGLADGASLGSSLAAGTAFGLGGAILAALLFLLVKLLGNDIPW